MPNTQSHLRARFSLDDAEFQRGLNNIASGVGRAKSIFGGAGGFVGIALAAAAAVGAVTLALSAPIAKAAAFEDAIVGFTQLLGSVEKAKARVEELTQFSLTTPFQMPGIMQASRVLEVLTKGALSTAGGLRLVGDVAAATDQPIQDLAMWIGRLYGGLMSGHAEGRALMTLQHFGVISGEVRSEIEKLQKSGAAGPAVWAKAAQAMERFSGLMDKRIGTWNGKMSNLADSWGVFLREVGLPIKDALTPYLDALRIVITRMIPSGQAFGSLMVAAGSSLLNTAMAVYASFRSVPDFCELAGAVLKAGFFEASVILDGTARVFASVLQEALQTIMRGTVGQGLVLAAQLFANAMVFGSMAAIGNLYEGFQKVVNYMDAGMVTVTQKVVEMLVSGFVKTVDWFSQGWRKAILDPIVELAKRMASMAVSFSKAIISGLRGHFAESKAHAEAMRKDNEEHGDERKARSNADLAIMLTNILGFKAKSFDQNLADSRGAWKSDAISQMMGNWKKEGEVGFKATMKGFGDLGSRVWDSLSKIFGTGDELKNERNKAVEELKKLIASMAPDGKRAFAAAMAQILPKEPMGPPAPTPKDGIFNTKAGLNWKSSQGLNWKSDAGLHWRTPSVNGTDLLGLHPSGGLGDSGGLTSGSLINPGKLKEQQDKELAKKEADRAKAATEGTQGDIKDLISDLLGVTRDTWQKKR